MFQHLGRVGIITSTSVALTLAAASCVGGPAGDALGGSAGSAGTVAIAGGSPGSGGVGGTVSSSGGAATTAAGTSATAGSSAVAGTSSSSAGASSMGGTSSNPPCTDNQHPDHMDKECSIWPEWDAGKPGEAKNCDAPWLTGAGYCLESCGKCSSGGGSGGTGNNTGGSGSGSGGTGLGPGPNLPNITSGEVYWASRYWDCCKTHCATNAGAQSCGVDGVSNNNSGSACANQGQAYACYSEAPRAIGDNVSYGHVAVPQPSCNSCYHIQFTGTGQHNANDPGSKAIAGKHMIVRVSNTGGDVAGHQFDLMIPGGGMGQNANTCTQQWGVSAQELGNVRGGFLSYENPSSCNTGSHADRKACVRAKCNLIPAGDARDGCYWWVDWLNLADNPQFRFQPIDCPSDI